MGFNDHMPDEGDFIAIAVQAGALKPCRLHPEVTINQWNQDANRRAYAITTNKWKSGELEGDRWQVLDMIKEIIDTGAEGCPICQDLHDT